jgi:cephalosporin-C deacetylase-like acetyl esterase
MTFAVLLAAAAAQLPDTQPFSPQEDFSALMVAGIHRYLDRETVAVKGRRLEHWQRDTTSPAAYAASVRPNRDRLARMLGLVDERLPVQGLELVGGITGSSSLVVETADASLHRVRWPVLDGVYGEGLLIQPKGETLARVIVLPDADQTPERWLAQKDGAVAAALMRSGLQVVIPVLLSRDCEFSGSERLGRFTNASHREWIYRQSFILGRHVIGDEIQKVLALVDGFARQPEPLPVCVAGYGEGGLLALYAGALDERIGSVHVAGHFAPREQLWKEPLERSVFGLLREFGDAELASLIAPRRLAVRHDHYPEVAGPPLPGQGVRAVAAPGVLAAPPLESVQAELQRALDLTRGLDPIWARLFESGASLGEWLRHLLPEATADAVVARVAKQENAVAVHVASSPEAVRERQRRQVRELEAFHQHRLARVGNERDESFWKPLPLKSLAAFEQHTTAERERFWNEVIGRLPDPDRPANPRSRLVRETETVAIYEVVLDVWQDVFAWGWLALPKDLSPGERRPVVVCQHGLEGLPEHCFETDPSVRAHGAYKAFALRLAEQGYITFAPHNPYRGRDAFRSLQRKLHPLGLSLFSVINGQHQRILEWLKGQPFVQPDKIAFYGLSYGGKSAMRTPAVLTDYCLSICSGDFNEWVRKCATIELPLSYVFTHEYEIWEWNLGGTFNYAEMAALIAPRPFMVERGHNDGVGIDEWVNYEFAKVRRLYNKLGIGERTEIEHFDGPHTIHGVGTFDFLRRHLGPPKVDR